MTQKIKITDNEVTLNFTQANIEGYASRLALSLIIHDHDAFSPEEAQRINTLIDTIEDNFTDEDNAKASEVLKNND